MKRCITCNRTFDEEWLSFCTQDGAILVEETGPAPTIVASAPTPPADLPAGWENPGVSGEVGQSFSPQPPVAGWVPPPPPFMPTLQPSGLATASMIIGIASVVCFGPVFAIVAIILGAMALSEIKKKPELMIGRSRALTGVITGCVALVLYGIFMIIYILFIVLANQ